MSGLVKIRGIAQIENVLKLSSSVAKISENIPAANIIDIIIDIIDFYFLKNCVILEYF